MPIPAGYTPTYFEFQPTLPPSMFIGQHYPDPDGGLGVWVDYPVDSDITIRWTAFDKSDIDPDTHGPYIRTGFYLSHFILQISTEPSFTDVTKIRPNVIIPANHNPNTVNGVVQNYYNIYSDMPNPGRGPVQTYSHVIDRGTLQSNKIYYFRIYTAFFVGIVNFQDNNNSLWPVTSLESSHGGGKVAVSSFTIQTAQNLPVVTLSAEPNRLGEFGGLVKLKWTADDATSVFIRPTTFRGLGGVQLSNTEGLDIDVDETTQFVLEATNENGKTTKSVTVEVSSPTGIIPFFSSSKEFSKSEIVEGNLVAKVGDTFDIQLYTEFMQDIRLFVAYPWAKPDSPITKIRVTPPDLLRNLIDQTTQTVNIQIPNPGHVLKSDMAISGAWGHDSLGKDGKVLREVSGYFTLIS